MKQIIPALCFGLLALTFILLPCEAKATSSEATDVLEAVAAENLDGKAIETIEVGNLNDENFSEVIQQYLNIAKERNDNVITRIVIPDGEYQPQGRALEIYSNTILDLRGSGAETLATADDYDNVIIYQTTKDNDPLSLRCGHQDMYGGDNSEGYDAYQNMTVLGGTFVGKRADGSTGGTTCNMRFGHASNVRIIGTQITDNHGAHHLEIGATKDVLVADCKFMRSSDGKGDESSTDAKSLEAIQLDVSHQEKDNFAYFGVKDDLPVINATITDCYFEDVVRGVGTHHGVFGHPYENIVIKNNEFVNIHDKAIHFLYTRNATIKNNRMDGVHSSILFQYMFPKQQYMPNNTDDKPAQAKVFDAGKTQIFGNEIYLDPSKPQATEGAEIKYGIRVGGKYLASKSYQVGAGTYRISGVQVNNNTIDVVNGATKKSIRAAILADYAQSCSIYGKSNTGGKGNIVNLRGCNEDGYGGIFVSYSPNVNVINNVVSGITGAKSNAILVSNTGGTGKTMVQDNSIDAAGAQYGVGLYKVTNKNLYVYKNTITNPTQVGVSVTDSKICNVTNNTIKMTNGKKMTKAAIRLSTGTQAYRIGYNKVAGTKSYGIQLTGKCYANYINTNTVTSPGQDGIMVNDSSTGKFVSYNTITGAGRFGITISNKGYAQEILKNTIKSPVQYGILVGDNSSAYLIQANTLYKCKKRSIIVNGKANAIVGNKVSYCPYKNKPYLKKGLSFTRYQTNTKKGKYFTVPYIKANTKGGVTWSSSNKKILKVVKKGKFKAVGKGTAYVKAKRNGVMYKAKVTVK